MKTTRLTCATEDSLREAVVAETTEWGSQGIFARKVGVSQATLSLFVNGMTTAGKAIAAYFEMEPRTVYVRKNDNQNKA